MATIGSAAHIRLKGFDKEGVDSRSPLEDQAVLTYKAARHYAQVNGFTRYVHRGVPGIKGPMVMKRITDTLFEDEPDKDERSKINGLVTQVLRKTDAAVCVRRPADGDRETIPEWFIADSMPSNLTIVALNHKHKEPIPQAKPLIPTRTEQRLSVHEAGEDLKPGEVIVKQGEPRPVPTNPTHEVPEKVLEAFQAETERRHREYRAWLDEVEAAVKRYQPVASGELLDKLKNADGDPLHRTTIRQALVLLAEEGRLVHRKETKPERIIRGGGSPPMGPPAELWAVAPGPVPTRRELPEGVQPVRSASEIYRSKREELDTNCEKVLAVLNRQYPAGTRPRTRPAILKAAGLGLGEGVTALNRLIELGMITNSGYRYGLSDNYGGRRTAKDIHQPAREDTVPVTPPAPPSPASTDGLVADIMEMVSQLARGSNAEEIESLRSQNAQLQGEVEKLTKQNKALRAAIVAMEE